MSRTALLAVQFLIGSCCVLLCTAELRCEEPPAKKAEPVKVSPWKSQLMEALSGIDRLVIQPLDKPGQENEVVIKGAEKLKLLLDRIEIDDARSGHQMLDEGDHLVRFYKGEKCVATISHLFGVAIRWIDGKWKGDGVLTEKAREDVPLWFKENGYPALQTARENRMRQAQEQAEQETRFLDCFPEKARKFVSGSSAGALEFEADDSERGRRIAETINDGDVLMVSVCRAFGTLVGHDSSWSMTANKERRALEASQKITGKQFLNGLTKLKDDRPALLGAARLYFSGGFRDKVPLEMRPELDARLAEIVLNSSDEANKSVVLGRLKTFDGPPARTLLRRVQTGETGKEMEREHIWSDEPGLRATATLALLHLGEPVTKEGIKQELAKTTSKQDKAAYEICLALLGDAKYLHPDQFALKSYTIGFAGLEAIERLKGKECMEALVAGAIHHPWGAVNEHAVEVFGKITGRKWSLNQIEAWWEEGADGQNPTPSLNKVGLIRTIRDKSLGLMLKTAMRPDGKQFAVEKGNDILLISVATGEREQTLVGHTKTILALEYAADGQRLTSMSADGTERTWNTRDGKTIKSTALSDGKESLPIETPDGRRFTLRVEGASAEFRDVLADKAVFKLDEPAERQITGCDMNASAERVAFTFRDGGISVRGFRQSDKPVDIKCQDLRTFYFSSHGKWLVGLESGRTMVVWDAATGERRLSVEVDSPQWPDHFEVTPDEKFLFCGNKKRVRVFDVVSGKLVVAFRAHTGPISSFSFSADGKILAIGGWEEVSVWDVAKILAQK